MSFKEDLKELFKGQSTPYLFIGSGFSRRYFGTPGWEELLREIAKASGIQYGKYVDDPNDLPAVASAMATDIKNSWYDGKFLKYDWCNPDSLEDAVGLGADMALKYIACQLTESHIKKGIPMYFNPDDSMGKNESFKDDILREELDIFSNMNPPAIITTNYDSALESMYKGYRVYGSQSEMISASLQNVGEIYKIHGTVSNHGSIVLTRGDYERFEQRNKYLIAKLLTIFTENPIVFIGYSLSDENIKNIFNGIQECLDDSVDIREAYERKFIFLNRPSDNAEERVYTSEKSLSNRISMKVTVIQTRDFREVFKAISETKIQVPAKLIRMFKEQAYKIATTEGKLETIYAMPLSDLEHKVDAYSADILVSGIGVVQPSIKSMNLSESRKIFLEGEDYPAYEYIEGIISRKGGWTWTPIFYYINKLTQRELESLSDEQVLFLKERLETVTPDIAKVKSNVGGDCDNSQGMRSRKKYAPAYMEDKTFSEVFDVIDEDVVDKDKTMTPVHKLKWVLDQKPENINSEKLRKYLITNMSYVENRGEFAKAVCYLDWMENHVGANVKFVMNYRKNKK